MKWNVIGQSVIGSSHIQTGKSCEDAQSYYVTPQNYLICFASDGAGSAKFAEEASSTAVKLAVDITKALLLEKETITENDLRLLAERIYDELEALAVSEQVAKNEFSCTLLGCILLPKQGGFLQIGDGAIVRNDGSGHFTPVWWPQNGEYQNTTVFLIDNPALPNLNVKVIDDVINEVGLFTDGLQMLTLNNETQTVHQPFFVNLFHWLRKADTTDDVSILNGKLIDYLSGSTINNRTDDDKTLILATRI